MKCLAIPTLTNAPARRNGRRHLFILVWIICLGMLVPSVAQRSTVVQTPRLFADPDAAILQKDPNQHTLPPRTIQGVKWLDRNNNGRREPDEPGLSGWTILVSDARGKQIKKAVTDEDGNYQFTQLQVGQYTLSEVHQSGWVQTFPKTAMLSVTLRDRGLEVNFGNRPCEEQMSRYDRDGNLILPPDADPSAPPTLENGNESTGHINDLYGAYGDTSTDLWYDKFPCQQSLDDGSEALPSAPDVESEMAAAGLPAKATSQQVNNLGPIVYNQVGAGQGFGVLGKVESPTFKTQAPHALDPTQPYSGRDIIYIHGLMPETIEDKLTASNMQAYTRWPQNQPAFEGNGYWKQAAKSYWSDHIGRLHAAGGKNRYLIVAWPSTQRLDVAVHAVLTQIARAMTAGLEVENPFHPSDKAGFCQANCVIVSHSAGALVGDVAMAVAEKTKSSSILQTQLGQIGFIPDHIKVHVAFHGAFSGSHYATAFEAVALGLGSPALCAIVSASLSALTKANSPTPASVCSQLSTIPNSVMADMVPEVAQGVWGPLVQLTPVPVLTVAGGHPSYKQPFKNVLLRGFDDGVVTMNSQCANPLPPGVWPSIYVPVPSPLNIKVFDRGISQVRATRYFFDQIFDKVFPPTPLPSNLAAATCTPFISPTGMLQPFSGGPPDPFARFNKHYSFIQSASDHMVGPIGVYDEGGCKNRDYLITAGSFANNEEERVITNSVVYQTDTRFAADPQPLVNSGMQTAVSEYVRYKRRKLFSLKKKDIYLYIWKRYYHLLDGYECMDEVDYVHRYVVR